jgi:hypothetical protein
LHAEKPKFGRFVTWGACSRCGARVRYDTLARERLTGLLVCTASSGRPVKPCLDPWPEVYDFQVFPDKSIEPPEEPLPARWGLDDIWSVKMGIKQAASDAERLQALLVPPRQGFSPTSAANFISYKRNLNQNQDRASVTYINPANYDGTFVPSNSVRTVTPPNAYDQLTEIQDESGWVPPWSVVKGV